MEIYEEEAVVFPVLHGPNGEDGTIQGFVETINMPYMNVGVLASANMTDKITTKYLLQTVGIPQVPFMPVLRSDWKGDPGKVFEECEGSLIYPVFVKPASMGSSARISKVENCEELQEALKKTLRYDARTIVEQRIEAREIGVAVLENRDVRTTLPGEVVEGAAFYGYDAEYINNTVKVQIPAHIPEEVVHQAQGYTKRACVTLGGSSLSRCNFFLTSKSELFLNGLSTMPGFTDFSIYPSLWESVDLKYDGLAEELIRLALDRLKQRQEFYNSQKERIAQNWDVTKLWHIPVLVSEERNVIKLTFQEVAQAIKASNDWQ